MAQTTGQGELRMFRRKTSKGGEKSEKLLRALCGK